MDGNITDTATPLSAHIPPEGFISTDNGIFIETTSKDGDIEQEWLCSPIAVVALGRNTGNNGWCRWIELVDADGVQHEWHVPQAQFNSSFTKVLDGLLDRGFRMAPGTNAKKHLAQLLTSWAPTKRYHTTDRLGWSDSTCTRFVLGDMRVIGGKDIVFLNDSVQRGEPAMHSRGSLATWRSEVSSRCKGNPVLMTSVSLAFAGPLVEFLNREIAGMHLKGMSSSGKTTSAKVAASVWGSPELVKDWTATKNAMEGMAAVANSSLLILNEIAEASAKEIGDAIYMLGNGQGKARSTSSGALRNTTKWNMTILSTGEITLAEKMAEAGQSTMMGQTVRMIEVSADTRRYGAFDVLHGETNGGDFAQRIEHAASQTYGVAGPAFVHELLKNSRIRSTLPDKIKAIASIWQSSLGLEGDGPAGRVLGHLAMIACAGQLASMFDVTDWDPQEPVSAAWELAKEWADLQERPEKFEIEATVERTRDYLLAHGETRFQRAGTSIDSPAGYRDDSWFYVSADTWNEIHAGHSPAEQANYLRASKWLVPGDGKNIKSKTPNWVAGRPRAYKIRAEIITAMADPKKAAA
ncbi:MULTISPECIES: DUF927 domain-containing protein [Marivita]|uniref:DUF927 domain-containing protein n=2 Tax=Marivita cryptomonadis TaxID=505252 RepID=A0A9Q2NUB9_9RHOB|nr:MULTISPECIES: DUF927 domain-containing protein [Marivita]MCR9168204.1 DUF927 domain-containing protein [Paracoccaceae bacterium]MBM2323031.1 DUF927 domain-containing protein [Marivita cryptomonadis]MBM2332614.1 DUF927 domain-containing protein [Marivita cryptomonadis]MBM2342197.1 DUF927 domain-containing protein [Marivita cryptomonadis]MBM2346862.1 DUF927 domain-containing protein [Marivita cryptomonadis]